MSLAELFYSKCLRRAQASRPTRRRALPRPRRFVFEPLEPRLLLSVNPVSGIVPVNTVWHAGDVQLIVGDVTVVEGQKLAIEPGAVIKVGAFAGNDVIVKGTLDARGTRARPIVFTSARDDCVGGDTNNTRDSTRILQEVVGIDHPEIPPLPGSLTPVTGADPFVNIPTTLSGTRGSTVTAPVMIDNAAGLTSVDLQLTYDATKLEVLGVRTGSVTPGGTLTTNPTPVTNAAGAITVRLALTTPRPAGGGSLIEIDYRIGPTATSGTTALNLTSVSLNEGGLVLTPAPSPGADATDGRITIVSNNTAPVAVDDAFTVNEDNTLVVAARGVLANDTDADGNTNMTAKLVSTTTHGTLTFNTDGSFAYTPAPNFNSDGDRGPDIFTYRANDGELDSNLATVRITVRSVNDAPGGADNTVMTLEDTPYKFARADFAFTDPNDNPPNGLQAVRIPTLPKAGTLRDAGTAVTEGQFVSAADIDAGLLVFTPAPDASGTPYASFTFQVQDNGGTANGGVDLDPTPRKLTVNVTPVNDRPVANPDGPYFVKENTSLIVPAAQGVLANDTDVDSPTLTAILSTGPNHGTLTLNADGSFTYTPDHNFVGDDTFTYRASDGQALSDPASVSLKVQAAATFRINDVTVVEGNSGTTQAMFTVTLDATVDTPVTVDYATADGTAHAGRDYQLTTGTLQFVGTAGETHQISVPVIGDTLVELDESFLLNLSNIQAGGRDVTFADAQGVGTITNDDAAHLSINDITVTEGNSGTTLANFTVALDAAVDTPVTVDYATADGTAQASSDYTVRIGTLTFAAGAAGTQTVSVPVTGDTLVELNENFLVNLSNIQAGGRDVTFADAQGQGTIVNDDAAHLSINDVTVTEGNSGTTLANFTVTLDAAVDTVVKVDYATADGTAQAGGDYTAANGTLTFAAGVAGTQTVSVAVTGDTLVELNENFLVNLSNIQAGVRDVTFADSQGQGTIVNDDAAHVSINDVTVTEGNSGTTLANFTVTLDAAVDTAVKVDFATADGTAQAGNDYTAANGTLTFAAGAAGSRSISVDVTGDTLVELNERFLVNLSNIQAGGRNVTFTDAQGQGTIVNDDAAHLSINDVTVTEGNSGTTLANFTVTLDAAVDTPVTVDYTTTNGTAQAGSDYTAANGALMFAAGAAGTQTVSVAVTGDTLVELDESFLVNLSNIQASGRDVMFADAQGVGTIQNDDTAHLSIKDVTVTEGNSGTTLSNFTVTLDAAVDTAVKVDFATADGTAQAGSDYTAGTGTLTFAAGAAATQTVSVAVTGDTLVELNETFLVNLSNIQAGGRDVTFADAQGVGTIANDDTAHLSINDVSVTEGNSGTTLANFTVTLDAAVDTPVTVDYITANGTAQAGSDYAAANGTLTFAAGAAGTQTVSVPVTGDTLVERNETFLVNLTNVQAAARDVTIADGQGVGTIVNDDPAHLSINDVTVTEGNSRTTLATFTVSLDAAVDTAVTVDYATANGTAQAGSDYTAANGTLTFAAGAAGTRTVSVDVTGDRLVELDENFLVNLTNVQAGGRAVTFADSQGQGTIVNDDTAHVSINDVTVAEGNSGTTLASFTVTLDAAVDTPVTVDYATANATAQAGSDYAAANGTLTFAAGAASSQTVSVPVTGDTLVEIDESFLVNLTNVQAGGRAVTFADSQGQGTIVNDDVAHVNINDVTVTEGNSGTTLTSFTVTLDAAVDTAVTVDYATANGTAQAGSDYTAANGTLTFAAGATGTRLLSVAVTGDQLVELDENFVVNLTNLQAGGRNVTITDPQGLGTIQNDDVAHLSINDVAVTEGNTGATQAMFTVTLDAGVDTPVTVDYVTANGTAQAGSDYAAANGTLTFAAGAAGTQTVSVAVTGDRLVELDESFLVNLTNVQAGGRNVTTADSQGVGTILNDDVAHVSINDVTVVEGNTGTTQAMFTVTLDAAVDTAVTVDYATANGTAQAGSDYAAANGTLTFAAGAAGTQTVSVAVTGDRLVELDESFLVNLTNVQAGGRNVTTADSQGVGTILNDDVAHVSINDVTVVEGNIGTTQAMFTVTLNAAVDTPVTVDYATANGTAQAGSDYAAANGTHVRRRGGRHADGQRGGDGRYAGGAR